MGPGLNAPGIAKLGHGCRVSRATSDLNPSLQSVYVSAVAFEQTGVGRRGHSVCPTQRCRDAVPVSGVSRRRVEELPAEHHHVARSLCVTSRMGPSSRRYL